MNNVDSLIKYNSLFLLYGELLSDSQKKILESYFCFNLSISEIATENEISRAAVEDAIKKGKTKLDEYEHTLHFLQKKQSIINELNKIKNNQDNLVQDVVKNIESELK